MNEPDKATTLLQAIQNVTDRKHVLLCCTLRELFLLVNEELKEECRVEWHRFEQMYLEGLNNYGKGNNNEATAMYAKIAAARVKQKLETFKMFYEDKEWRRFQWVLETRFPDFDPKTRGDYAEKEPAPAFVYTSRVIDADEEA